MLPYSTTLENHLRSRMKRTTILNAVYKVRPVGSQDTAKNVPSHSTEAAGDWPNLQMQKKLITLQIASLQISLS